MPKIARELSVELYVQDPIRSNSARKGDYRSSRARIDNGDSWQESIQLAKKVIIGLDFGPDGWPVLAAGLV